MADKIYRKKNGGYPHWQRGGGPEIKAEARRRKGLVQDAISEVRAEGVMLFQGRFGNNGFEETNGVMVEVWRVDGCDWMVSPGRLVLWSKVAKAYDLPEDFKIALKYLGNVQGSRSLPSESWDKMKRSGRVRFSREAAARELAKHPALPTPELSAKLEHERRVKEEQERRLKEERRRRQEARA